MLVRKPNNEKAYQNKTADSLLKNILDIKIIILIIDYLKYLKEDQVR